MGWVVKQAIEEFAKAIAKADPDQTERDTNGFVNGHAWFACAEQVLAEKTSPNTTRRSPKPLLRVSTDSRPHRLSFLRVHPCCELL